MNTQTSIYLDEEIFDHGKELQEKLRVKSFSKLVEWLIEQEYDKLKKYKTA